MANFKYDVNDGSLNPATLSLYFNRHRVYKYLLDTLIKLNKIHFSQYKVLEPACGGGDKLRFFTEWNVEPENCYGIELAQSAVDLCQKLSPVGMNFQVADAFNMPFDNDFFDIVLCSGLFGCYQNDDDVFKLSDEINRVLKTDGVFIVCDLNENFSSFYGNNPVVMAKNLRGYDTQSQQLERLLASNFKAYRQMPIFAVDIYTAAGGSLMDISQFPALDHQIDSGNVRCSYSFWAFTKN